MTRIALFQLILFALIWIMADDWRAGFAVFLVIEVIECWVDDFTDAIRERKP